LLNVPIGFFSGIHRLAAVIEDVVVKRLAVAAFLGIGLVVAADDDAHRVGGIATPLAMPDSERTCPR
jgi:hypothetical protein